MLEFQQFQDKIRKELHRQMKFSRDLIELRDREQKLVRVKRYEEAEKVKMKADLLEEFERNKLEAEVRKSYDLLSRCDSYSTICVNSNHVWFLDASNRTEEGIKVTACITASVGCFA